MGPTRKQFLALIGLGLALRLSFAWMTPLFPDRSILPGYNDEPLHLFYVQHLAAGGGIPVWGVSADTSEHLAGEFTQPPLYYATASSPYKLGEALHNGWGMYLARLVSVICGLVAALFTYRIATLWFRNDGGNVIALGAFAAMLLAPNAVVFSSIVTNDALLMALSALSLYSIIRCRSESTSVTRQFLTGLFIAAAVWTKLSGLLLIPLIWFAAPPEASPNFKWALRLRIGLVAVMGVMPLFAWNLAHYGHIIPRTPGYDPESVLGITGGAVHHPVMALKIWLRTAAQPLDAVWGSLPEKLVSLVWVVIWGGVTTFGAFTLLKGKTGGLFLTSAALLLLAFIYRNIGLFQVEFRTLAPAFPALAVMAGVGAAGANLSVITQVILWVTPLVILPFL